MFISVWSRKERENIMEESLLDHRGSIYAKIFKIKRTPLEADGLP